MEADAPTVKVADNDVVLRTFTALAVTPAPLTATVVAPLTKFVPVSDTPTAVPWVPLVGETDVSVGTAETDNVPLVVNV
jgi:hypothetical protein